MNSCTRKAYIPKPLKAYRGLAGIAFCLLLGACGGGGNGGGGNPPPPPAPSAITSVTVAPTQANLEIDLPQQFTATVTGSGSFSTAVTWHVNNVPGGDSTIGTISSSGLYRSPLAVPQPPFCTQVANGCQVVVKATSQADQTKSASATVTITAVQQPRLEWVRFVDFGQTMRDYGFGVAVDGNSNIVAAGIKWLRSWSNSGQPIPDPIAALVSFDPAGNERWRNDFGATPSLLRSIAREGNQDRFYFTGVTNPAGSVSLRSAMFGQVNGSGQLLLDPFSKSFQFDANETSGRIVQVSGSLVYVAVNTATDPRVAILDLSGNMISSFQVGNIPGNNRHGSVTVCDKCTVTGMYVAADRLWVSGDRFVGGQLVGFYLERFNLLDLDAGASVVSVGGNLFGTRVIEDSQGGVYLAGTNQNGSDPNGRLFLVEKRDQQGQILWFKSWDGDNPNANASTLALGLTARPSGGVVVVGQLTELQGVNPKCTTYPNCWDFGILALDSNGNRLWKLRHDFNSSPWDVPEAVLFDGQGKLVVVGATVPNPTGNDFTDNRDILVSKFRVP